MKINSFSVGSAPNHNEDFLEYVNMGIDGYAVCLFLRKNNAKMMIFYVFLFQYYKNLYLCV